VREEVTRATSVVPFCLYRPVPDLSGKNPSSYFGSLYADACWLLVLIFIFGSVRYPLPLRSTDSLAWSRDELVPVWLAMTVGYSGF
jgi:hypothetical protein